jgi:hypothetical protein
MAPADWRADITTQRRYERGENRRKHVGTSPEPEFVITGDDVIGKCPAGRTPEWRQYLIDHAVGYMTAEPYSLDFPKRLFAVDKDGTIYTAQTSNPGDSYHGYPYTGQIGKRLLAALEAKAQQMGCQKQFNTWVKKHITVAGRPDL